MGHYKWFANNNDCLSKLFWSLRRSPIVLFNLLCAFFRCKLKSNLVSSTILKYFLEEDDLTKFWWKSNGGWLTLLILLLKITFWACLLGSELKFIFHGKAQALILLKSLFKLVVVELIFWTTEKKKASSANNFGFQFKSYDKSLIKIRKNEGPRIDPWGTPA